MRDSVFYTICLGFMGGVFLRSFFDVELHLLGCLMALTFLGAWKLLGSMRGSILCFMALITISGAVGAWRMDRDARAESAFVQHEDVSVMLEARVVREPEIRAATMHLYVEPIDTQDTNEKILVTVDRFAPRVEDIAYGDEVSVMGTLERPESFATDGGRVFDYPGYLRARDVHYVVRYGDIKDIREGSQGLMRSLFAYKQQFQSVVKATIPQPEAGLGEGVLLGVRRALGTDLEEAFRVTGIIHIVVLSGYNIMIVVTWLTYILSFLFPLRTRTVVGVCSIFVFVLLVGASATAIRAGIMASLLLVARSTGRTYAILRALMLAAIVMLLANPFLLVHDTGFQLSFLATLGLIVLAPHVERWLVRIPEFFFGLRTIVAATIATQIMVLPLLLYHTGLLSVVAIAVNVLVLPAVSTAMLLTFLTGTLGSLLAPLGTFFGFLAYLSLTYIIKVAEAFAAIPFSAISLGFFPFWIVPLAYVFLAVWIRHLSRREARIVYTSEDLSEWTIEEEQKELADVSRTHASSSLQR